MAGQLGRQPFKQRMAAALLIGQICQLGLVAKAAGFVAGHAAAHHGQIRRRAREISTATEGFSAIINVFVIVFQ